MAQQHFLIKNKDRLASRNDAGDLTIQIHPRPRKDNYPDSPTVCKIPRPVLGMLSQASWQILTHNEDLDKDDRLLTQLDSLYSNDLESICPSRSTDDRADCSTSRAYTQWPPKGLKLTSKLSAKVATALICNAALSMECATHRANYNTAHSNRFYASVTHETMPGRRRMVDQLCESPDDISLTLLSTVADAMPWGTLEQPSMAHCFGSLAGTVTLNHFVSLINRPIPSKHFPEYGIMARQTDDLVVLQRLHYLQSGMDPDLDAAETFLYTQLLEDPDWVPGVPEPIVKQIAVLVAALDNPIWLDFRNPSLHNLAEYYDSQNPKIEQLFYQQLMLSVELYVRIASVTYWVDNSERLCMIQNIPENVAYDLALAQIWLSKMRLEPLNGYDNATTFHITAITKDVQKEKLLEFAKSMEWAGIADVEAMLKVTYEGIIPLECKSSHSAAWISGLVLPGPSVSWLLMRSLIDCDSRIHCDQPGFVEMYSNLGFQYDGSTYWYWECIVGKVLGACKDVNQDYGWIGPCLSTKDVNRRHSILIHSDKAINHMTKSYARSMSARTAALGPPTDSYPVNEFILPLPSLAHPIDTVKFLELKLSDHILPTDPSQPEQYSASLGFTAEGRNGWMRLRYDVSFISCPPCQGQHLLFWDYVYEVVDMVHLLTQQISWNGVSVHNPTPGDPFNKGKVPEMKPEVPESILVVEAYGIEDNEVMARAWASHIGFSAVVANVNQTCMACSIRMAYAACVPMLILTNRNLENTVDTTVSQMSCNDIEKTDDTTTSQTSYEDFWQT